MGFSVLCTSIYIYISTYIYLSVNHCCVIELHFYLLSPRLLLFFTDMALGVARRKVLLFQNAVLIFFTIFSLNCRLCIEWLRYYYIWMDGPFEYLDPVTIETSVARYMLEFETTQKYYRNRIKQDMLGNPVLKFRVNKISVKISSMGEIWILFAFKNGVIRVQHITLVFVAIHYRKSKGSN